MIVKPSFFKNQIYLPHAKASITDSVTDVESKLEDFINIYEKDALQRCLGKLSAEFFDNLDENESSLIKVGSDDKWDWLMNGYEYTKANGDECTWRGLREVRNNLGYSTPVPIDPLEPIVEPEPNYSFLAEYVYFFYEQNDFISRTDAGNAKVKSANASMQDPSFKVIGAWRRFVKAVQGESEPFSAGFKRGFLGGSYIDYRGDSVDYDVNLYRFINDMNSIEPLDIDGRKFYHNFNPKRLDMINRLTI